MKKNSVSEFELEKEDFKIKLKRSTPGGTAAPVGYEEAPLVTYAPPMALAVNATLYFSVFQNSGAALNLDSTDSGAFMGVLRLGS